MDFKHDILPLRDRLFRLSLRITLNREEAEDVVQDVMLRLWQQRDKMGGVTDIENYALTMTRNLSLDRNALATNRSVSLNEELHDRPNSGDAPSNPLVATPSWDASPDQHIMHAEASARFHRLINSLPEKQRTVLHLRDIEGKAYTEIAQLLSISESDVKVTIFRARKQLKELLTTPHSIRKS